MEKQEIKPGDIYKHHSSGVYYVVIAMANTAYDNPDYPACVVYMNPENKTCWTKPIDNFRKTMTQLSL